MAKSKARTGVPTVNFSSLAFFKRHEKRYEMIWRILGRRWTNIFVEAAWAIEAIPGANHGALKIVLTEDQKKRMLPHLAAADFFRASYLPPGDYDDVHATGAKRTGMDVRIADFKARYLDKNEQNEQNPNKRYKFGRITCLVGMRPRQVAQVNKRGDVNPMDGTVEETIADLSPNVRNHPWVQEEMRKLDDPRPVSTSVEDQDLWWGPFETECKLMVLSWLKAFDGNLDVLVDDLIEEEQIFPDVPARTFGSITLRLPDGTEVLVLNAPAVERPQGAPRPTTLSTTAYWLDNYSPVFGASLVTISSPYHWERVTRDFEYAMHQVRPDVTVFCISRGEPKPMNGFNQAMGEVAHQLVKAVEEMLALLPDRVAAEMRRDFERMRREVHEYLTASAQS
jgi:hypothetical protein